jgi:hypothetical protein
MGLDQEMAINGHRLSFSAVRDRFYSFFHQVTLYIFVMSLAGALMAPALPELAKKYGSTIILGV